MNTLKYNIIDSDTFSLQFILMKKGYNVQFDGIFGKNTKNAVIDFQEKNNLSADGIVGAKTWDKLLEGENISKLSENDFIKIAKRLDVDVATVKAVQEVETAGRGGFFALLKPAILFEGHIFWSELKKRGIDPNKYSVSDSDICYPKWDKKKYSGGIKEYNRLSKAMKINIEAALSSCSWGMFQIMGFNHKSCEKDNVYTFVKDMYDSEYEQLNLFAAFVENNNLVKYLKSHNWDEFAKRYNGSGYKANKYDTKLASAYKKYSLQ